LSYKIIIEKKACKEAEKIPAKYRTSVVGHYAGIPFFGKSPCKDRVDHLFIIDNEYAIFQKPLLKINFGMRIADFGILIHCFSKSG
jgi:hypothetical protein